MKNLGVKFFVALSLFSVMPSSALANSDLEERFKKERLAEVLQKEGYVDGREVFWYVKGRPKLPKLVNLGNLDRENLFSMLEDVIKDDTFMSKGSLPIAAKNLEMLKQYGDDVLLKMNAIKSDYLKMDITSDLEFDAAIRQLDDIDRLVGIYYSRYKGDESEARLFEELLIEERKRERTGVGAFTMLGIGIVILCKMYKHSVD